MKDIVFELYSTNRKLSQRFTDRWVYRIFVGFFFLLFLIMFINDFLNVEQGSTADRNLFLRYSAFIILVDAALTISRFQTRSFIEPNQLYSFPISGWNKFVYHQLIHLTDYKSSIYLLAISFYSILFIQYSLYLEAFYIALLWLMQLFIISSWAVTINGIIGIFSDKLGRKIQLIGLFSIGGVYLYERLAENPFATLPVARQAGSAIYGFWIHNPSMVWTNVLDLIGFLAVPIVLYLGLAKFKIIH